MNKKEICETAYNLICGLSDIQLKKFWKKLKSKIKLRKTLLAVGLDLTEKDIFDECGITLKM